MTPEANKRARHEDDARMRADQVLGVLIWAMRHKREIGTYARSETNDGPASGGPRLPLNIEEEQRKYGRYTQAEG